jgi:hypothetical protein
LSDITTEDILIAAALQRTQITKTATRTSVAATWFSVIDLAGSPGAGVLAGTNTANGVVPTDATAGCPPINAFGGAATGRISRLKFSSSVACTIRLYDLLFKAGAYAFNAAQALSAQPSYSARLPGTDYKGLEIWAETVTAATGNQAWTVTYTDQDGNAGATTGAVGIGAAPTVGRCWQLPFATGDSGVQLISNVTGTVATVGTANILVLRPLGEGRVKVANDQELQDYLATGLPQVYDTSALFLLIAPDSTSTGIPDVKIDIRNA